MAKKKNPCKFILLKTGEELNFDQARDFLFKNYDFNTKTLKSESYAVSIERPSEVSIQPKEGVGRTMAEEAPQAKPEVIAEKGKSVVPSKTDKSYQEAQGVTERISKAHPEASVLILPKGEDLSLTALYVGKEKRGKGIGSAVLASVKMEADKLGKKVILDATNELDAEINLDRLGKFYEKNGFTKIGDNKFEYTPGTKVEELLTSTEYEKPESKRRPESSGDRGRREESGRFAPLEGAPSVPGINGPDPQLVAVAEQYARDNGIDLKRQGEYVRINVNRAKRIADAYEKMKHDPNNPKVKEAYQNLIKQTIAQYEALVKAGYKFWFMDTNIPGNVEYADSPYNALRDLRQNKQMGVFPTTDGYGTGDFDSSDNPLLIETKYKWPVGGLDGELKPVLANDLFRAVHDAFGHGLEGAGFRARGEENAWQAHIRLFTGSAKGAITSETRGQKSWLNYGPHGEKNRTAKTEETIFSDQKTGLMPEWTWKEGIAPDFKEKITPTEYEVKKEDVKPMLEGVRGIRPEEKGREVSPGVRAEEEAKREEEVKIEEEKAKAIEAGKKIADKIRGLKIKSPGAQMNIAGIPIALYNTAIETVATAIEKGSTLKAAIDSAIKKHNLNKQKDFNRDEFIKSLEDATELKYEEGLEVIAKSGEERIESEKKAAKETVKAQKKAAEEAKINLTADADSGDMIDGLFKKAGEKTEKKIPTKAMQPIPKAKESVFPKEVQQRMDEARVKPQQENWFTKAVARLKSFGLGFSRMYVELDPKKYGQVIDILRTLKNADQRAKELAERHMQNILGDLDNNQKAIFQDYVIASDMLGSIEDGLYETDLEWSDRSGPFGFESFQEVRDAVERLEQKLNEDLKIKEAVDRRNEFINAMWNTSKKAGLVSGEQVGSGRSYFHRQVLKFQEENNASAAILKSSARRKKLSQFKRRKGSTMDYYTNFPEVEAGVVMSTAFEIIKRQEINSIEKIYKPIYEKFKAESIEKAQKAVDKVKSEFGEDSKEYQLALENQKNFEDKILVDLMGDEYTIYFPDGKNSLFKTEVITGDAAEKAIQMITDGYVESGIDNLTDGIKPAVMMMKGRRMFIPNDIAKVFDRLGAAKAGQEPAIELFKDFVSGSTKIFKKMALLSPFRVIKYIYGNFAGDADRIAATDRRIIARVPDAIKMIMDARKNNKYDPIYDLAIKYGVIGSGSKIEIGDVSSSDWSKFAMDRKGDIQDFVKKALENMGGVKWSVEKYFDIVGNVASTREDIFRLAAFIRALEKTKKGEQFYWFSRKTEVDQITDPRRKAAKIAREIFGDYGAISQNGEFMAKYLMPFYRFRETNIRAYKNYIFNNFDTKEGKKQILKYGVAKGVTKTATEVAMYSAKMALFTAVVYAWNNMMFPEEEDELRAAGDQSFHIILGRRDDGSVRVMRTQGTLNAFMESLGITGLIQLYKDYENKDVTMADVAKEPSKAFANEFYQGLTPYIKIPFELASGKSRFPNLFRPRTIRDNTEYLFSSMSLRVPYEMLSGKPTLKKDYADLFLTSSMNPKEIAYYQAINKTNEDIGTFGMNVVQGESVLAKGKAEKSEALWRYKMNVKFGNTEEADKDLIKYYQLGGTPQSLKQTVKALDPLNKYSDFLKKYINQRIEGETVDFSSAVQIGNKMRISIKNVRYIINPEEIEYAKSLSKKDIKMFEMAVDYYNKTYKGEK